VVKLDPSPGRWQASHGDRMKKSLPGRVITQQPGVSREDDVAGSDRRGYARCTRRRTAATGLPERWPPERTGIPGAPRRVDQAGCADLEKRAAAFPGGYISISSVSVSLYRVHLREALVP
jgi:hypothetical protein